MNEILDQIRQERLRQIEKWGTQNRNAAEWICILGEEFGEASKEATDWHFNLYKDSESDVRERFKKELIQTAAVCVQILEWLDNVNAYNKIEIDTLALFSHFEKMTDEEITDFFVKIIHSAYCRFCGTNDPKCQCWNDE